MEKSDIKLRRSVFVLSAIAVLSCAIGGYLYYSTLRESGIERLHSEAAEDSKDMANHIDDIAGTFDGAIVLAILDIVLPDMDGKKIYPLLIKARPNLKVLVYSGYSIDGPAQEILDAGAQDFIQKPFSITALSEKLKGLLEN